MKNKALFVMILMANPYWCTGQDLSLLIGQWCLYKIEEPEIDFAPIEPFIIKEFPNCREILTIFPNNTFEKRNLDSSNTLGPIIIYGTWDYDLSDLNMCADKILNQNEVIEFLSETQINNCKTRSIHKILNLQYDMMTIANTYFGIEALVSRVHYKRVNN